MLVLTTQAVTATGSTSISIDVLSHRVMIPMQEPARHRRSEHIRLLLTVFGWRTVVDGVYVGDTLGTSIPLMDAG